MRIVVLGSGAGGGVPQWNCRCRVCAIAWEDSTRVRARSQTSVAVSPDGVRWVLLDAAPELRQQILATPALHPRLPGRGSPIVAVVLTSGEVDHLAGLLCLREGHAFDVYGTQPTLQNLAASPVFDVLRTGTVGRRPLALGEATMIAGLSVMAFAVPGKVPLYAEEGEVAVGRETEDVVGLMVADGARRMAYVPGIAHLTPSLRTLFGAADLLLLDGTTFTDDELIALDVSAKTAGRMGHLPMTGRGGSLHAFAADGPCRRVYIHINNTNPVLIEDSPERAAVESAGWTVAHDGLDITL